MKKLSTVLPSALLTLAILSSACDGGDSRPNSATPTAPTPPAIVSYILSGVVFEIAASGRVPIEGAEVYCDSCGSPVGHTFVYTDTNGFYSLAWAMNGAHPLFVTKAGYEISDPTDKLRDAHGRITATVHGDTRFDIQLARR